MILRKLKTFWQLLIGREFRWMLKRISDTLPVKFFYYNRVTLLELKERKTFRRHGGVAMRHATPDDLDAIAACVAKPTAQLRARFAQNDLCFLAQAGDAVVSVEWVAFRRYWLEEVNYTFDPGPQGIFLYDAYTAPEWRLRGIHVSVLQYLVESLQGHSVARVYCHITHGNDLSLQTHLRFGFKIVQYITHVRIFGLSCHLVKDLSVGKREYLFNHGADHCLEKNA